MRSKQTRGGSKAVFSHYIKVILISLVIVVSSFFLFNPSRHVSPVPLDPIAKGSGRLPESEREQRLCTDEGLFNWARAHGATIDKLRMAEFWFEREEGAEGHWLKRMAKRRGVIATAKIRKGEVVLSVPFELLVSVEGAEKTELNQVLKDMPGLDSYSILALMLLQERSKGVRSSMFPYVCSIPPSFSTPPYWGRSSLKGRGAEWLSGTNLDLQNRRLRQVLARKFNAMLPLLSRKYPNLFPRATHSFRHYVWAMSAVYSRNWGITDRRNSTSSWHAVGSGGQPQGAYGRHTNVLVPLADLLNHHAPSDPKPCYLDWLANGTRIGMIAQRDYEVGQEVFSTYGTDCNARFLASYGFAPNPKGRDIPCNKDLTNFRASLVKMGGNTLLFPHDTRRGAANQSLPVLLLHA